MIIRTLEEVEDTIRAMDDGRLDYIEKLLADVKRKRDIERFPIRAKFYAHSDKESNFDLGSELNLNDKQLENFVYTGYEGIEFDIEIDSEGTAYATSLNGVKLSEKIKI